MIESSVQSGHDKEIRDFLKIQGENDLARRSVSASFGQIALIVIYYYSTRFRYEHPGMVQLLGLVILTSSGLRAFLAGRRDAFYPDKRTLWNQLFNMSVAIQGLAWGLLFYMSLTIYGLSSYTTTTSVLIGSGISAAVTLSLIPRQNLARVFITLAIGLPLISLVRIEDMESYSMGLIFLSYYVFLWAQLRNQSSIYWAGLTAERKKIQETNRLRNLLDAIPGLVSWVNEDFRYLGVNKNYLNFFGKTAKELIGEKISVQIHDRDYIKGVEDFMRTNLTSSTREVQITKGANPRWYLNVMRKAEGVTYLICIDIDDLKKTRSELADQREKVEASSKLAILGEITSDIAHEIKNPLSSIVASSELMRELIGVRDLKALDPEKIKTIADQTVSASRRIEKIINGLTRFSRKSENEPFVTLGLDRVVRDTLELIERQFRDQRISLDIEGIKPEMLIRCHPIEISQVLLNLLNNAIEAAKATKDRWVRIRSWFLGNTIVLSITDSGHGIPSDIASRVFEPFFTTKPPGRGTGLGLSISKRIIERHGGRLEVDRTASNTTFLIILPIAAIKTGKAGAA